MEPVTISVREASNTLGLGLTKTYELINAKKLSVVRIGRRTLVRTDSIRALVNELAA